MQTQQLINSLVNVGIDTYFIAPGSRNYELIESINSVEGARSYVHYDERGLAFFALGYALATRKIAAIVVTSGTAVGLLLSAVMEAYHSGITLLLLTADRPASLLGTGANQTCDQRSIFSTYTQMHLNLDLNSLNSLDPKALCDKILSSALSSPGPIHLNCHLRAPSEMNLPRITRGAIHTKPVEHSRDENQEWDLEMEEMIGSFLHDPGALLLLGRNPPLQEMSSFQDLQIPTACTVITDLLSQCRGLFSSEVPLALFINNTNQTERKVSRVLHLGGSFIDTALLSYLERQPLTEYVQISSPSFFFDPHRKLTRYIPHSPWGILKKLAEAKGIPPQPHDRYQPELLPQGELLRSILSNQESHMPIFVSNSTLVRDFDQFYYPHQVQHPFYSNRGLSGSDGNLATFSGICLGLGKKCMGFLGDIAFLHDVSSLPLLKQLEWGASLFIFNNRGGDIFRRLGHSKKSAILESHYATSHTYCLAEIIRSYGIDCERVESDEELDCHHRASLLSIWEVDANMISMNRELVST